MSTSATVDAFDVAAPQIRIALFFDPWNYLLELMQAKSASSEPAIGRPPMEKVAA